MVVGNNFSAPTPNLRGENYKMYAIKKNAAYLKGLSLREVVENDVDPVTLPSNPKLTQLKNYEEDLAKKLQALQLYTFSRIRCNFHKHNNL